MYHRVAEVERDRHQLCVRPDRFEAQVAWLAERVDVVPLERALQPAASPRVVVTFDDGYADNATVAAPILERHGVPATMFVVSGVVGSQADFWWDELERLVMEPV